MRPRVIVLLIVSLVIGIIHVGFGTAAGPAAADEPYVPETQAYKRAPHEQTGKAWTRPAKPAAPRGLSKRGDLPSRWEALLTAEPGKPTKVAPVDVTDGWDGKPLARLDPTTTAGDELEGRYRIALVDPKTADKIGAPGLVFEVAADPGSDTSASFVLDYDALAELRGRDWVSRLQLATLPPCALSTPDRPACQTLTPLATSENDEAAEEVSATLPDIATTPTADDSGDAPAGDPAGDPAARATLEAVGQSVTLIAAVAGPGGSQGDYTASDLSPSGSWSTSGSSGSFTWNYPIPVTAPAGGSVAPSVGLSYDSASVDGLNSNTNPQGSWIGLGFDYQPGYIERTYRTCKDLTSTSTDKGLCWAGEILTMRLPGGGTQELVVDTETGKIRPKSDSGERIERLTGAQNGGLNGEHWRVTTTNGTRYTFGANVLPGGTTAKATRSAWNVPVYGGTSADGCAARRCTRTWRWNLDMVEDVHHNVAAYYYTNETNYFVPSGTTTRTAYDRGGYLTRIDYGITNVNGTIYGVANPPNRVTFTAQERCNPTSTVTCTDAQFVVANSKNWPDVPIDQSCTASGGTCSINWPTFWTRKKLATVATSYYSGTAYVGVDSYALTYVWSQSTSTPALDLYQIRRTATTAGQTQTLPPVTFGYTTLHSRVKGYKSLPDIGYDRLVRIQSETGALTQVIYSGTDTQYDGAAAPRCAVGTMPASPDNNNRDCYPVNWVQPFTTAPTLDYFHKYAVVAVVESDPNGLTPSRITKYRYSEPGWHHDDNESIKPARRTWSQWRGYRTVETLTGDPNQVSQNGTQDQTTLSRSTYYLGMDGDRLADGSNRSVTFKTSRDTDLTKRTDSDAYAGMLAETQVFDGATEISSTRHTPDILATTATRVRSGLVDLKARVVRTLKTVETTTGTGAGTTDLEKTTTTSWKAASANEPFLQRPDEIRTTATGGTGSATATCTATSYADNAATWVRNAPAEVSTYAQSCATGTELVARTRSYYDGSAGLGATNITAGDVTKSEAATHPENGELSYATTTTTYDSLGRVKTTTTYPDGTTSLSTARTTSQTYTANPGGVLTGTTTTLPTMTGITGPVTTTQTFDPARGVATRSTDAAGRITSATIDALGRYTAVWRPGRVQGTHTASTTYAYQYASGVPLAVTTKTLIDPGNSVAASYDTTVAILDSRGTLRQTQTDTPSGGRMVVDTFVDSHGWVVRTNDRWYTSGAPATSVIGTLDAYIDARTTTIYDQAGRATTVQRWRGTETQPVTTTKTIYGGDRTTILPPQGAIATTTLLNGLGQTTELRRYTEPVTPTSFSNAAANRTTYGYAPSGGIATMTTAAGTDKAATWHYDYDLLGRQIRADDPDNGLTATTYDDTGAIKATTDAADNTVTTSYDAWGRSTQRHAGTTAPGTLVASWAYDTLATGELTSSSSYVTDSSGQQRTYTTRVLGYSAQGLPTGTELSLNVPGLFPTYTTRATYTTTGLPATTTLASTRDTATGQGASAEKLTHWYNRLGLEEGLTGVNTYLNDATYSPYREAIQYVLGVNNATSALTYTRDPHNRWITNTLLTGQFANPEIENVAATYDAVGNTTRTVDTQGPPGSPTQTTCYRYDALQQLTDAWTATDNCAAAPSDAVTGGINPFRQSWTHDAAGGRETQTIHALPGTNADDTLTTYDNGLEGHQHALASATTVGTTDPADTGVQADLPTSLTATYTPTGATDTLTAPTGDTQFDYRADGSLATITAPNGDTTEYINDAEGATLLRIDSRSGVTDTTLYLPGQQLRVRDDTGAKTTTVTRYYTLSDGQQIAVRKNTNNPQFTLTDPHGTAQLTYDAFNTSNTPVLNRRALDPYGNQLSATTPAPWIDDRTYLNRPLNPVTNLVDMGARRYDPTTGRFTSVDPLLNPTDPTQANGYNYANNNPITYSDPTGTHPSCNAGDECTGVTIPHPEQQGGSVPAQTGAISASQTHAYDGDGLFDQVYGDALDEGESISEARRAAFDRVVTTYAPGTPEYEAANEAYCIEFGECPRDLIKEIIQSTGKSIEGCQQGSLSSCGWATFDIVTYFPGAWPLKSARVTKVAIAANGASKFGSLTHASAGIASYRTQKAVTAGHRGSIQAHHLVERRFARQMGGKTDDWPTIVVTRSEHQVFTNAWRDAIPYGAGTRTASRHMIQNAARQIYGEYPEILQALGLK